MVLHVQDSVLPPLGCNSVIDVIDGRSLKLVVRSIHLLFVYSLWSHFRSLITMEVTLVGEILRRLTGAGCHA